MRHEIGEEQNANNGHKKVAARRNSSAEIEPRATDTLADDVVEEIDPADFFDPEEFGYRRGVRYGR